MRQYHAVFLLYAWGFIGNGIFLMEDVFISLLAEGFTTRSLVLRRRLHLSLTGLVPNSRGKRADLQRNAENFSVYSAECETTEKPLLSYAIRDCTHKELSSVADLIVDSFYNYSTANSVWKQFTKLAELNRIQKNFPYGDDRAVHRMMVLTATIGNVTSLCGFVDVDARKPNRPTSYKYNPRPYLSDLCIHPNFRRYGYATLLIEACETFCRSELPKMVSSSTGYRRSDICTVPELYIRVETSNTAAGQMYQKLGYAVVQNHSDAGNDKIMILHKCL